ncbi:MAG: hypothetical protein V4471_07375 [Pseudomonadota bacterium]
MPVLQSEKNTQKSKDIYPFIIDCSLDKKGKMLVYEIQPLVYSGLGREDSNIAAAFEKAFPEISFELNYKNIRYLSKKKASKNMLISDKHSNTLRDTSSYDYIHTAPNFILNQLCNKVYQRLYLPSEVSPEHTLFDLSLDRTQEIKRVVRYFKEKNITKIVLKHPDAFMGNGNVFIDSPQDGEALRKGVEKLGRKVCDTTSVFPSHLLVESQNAFPRISRKTGEEKPGFTAYRIVGIADENGILGYFIATKSISPGVNSHERTVLKAYFDGGEKRAGSFTQHCGLKDKYSNIGSDRILIDLDILEKTFKAAYSLYHDLSVLSADNFTSHIHSLVRNKKADEEIKAAQAIENKGQAISKSFLSVLRMLNPNGEVTVKTRVKGGQLDIYVAARQPRLPLEISSFLDKIIPKGGKSAYLSRYGSALFSALDNITPKGVNSAYLSRYGSALFSATRHVNINLLDIASCQAVVKGLEEAATTLAEKQEIAQPRL